MATSDVFSGPVRRRRLLPFGHVAVERATGCGGCATVSLGFRALGLYHGAHCEAKGEEDLTERVYPQAGIPEGVEARRQVEGNPLPRPLQ
eukprot:1196137-Prorocentrum_minimum.AAC.2